MRNNWYHWHLQIWKVLLICEVSALMGPHMQQAEALGCIIGEWLIIKIIIIIWISDLPVLFLLHR